MTTNELIAILRDEDDPNVLDYIQEAADTLQLQKVRIMELEAELKDERHRHDRYVDFELAEAAELAKLKEERRWIPVTERLPETTCLNLAMIGDLPFLAYYDGKQWRSSGTLRVLRVEYWMPLPEPPKEGS